VDPRTGAFYPDTRYGLLTKDGVNIYVQSTGYSGPSGEAHIRTVFETGNAKYFWLNNIVGKFSVALSNVFQNF
jgi:hypothetical protein